MKIVILGGGSFGTALANQLAVNTENELTILLKNEAIRDEINQKHYNSTYFLNRKLNESIKASTDFASIKNVDVLFIAVPTRSIASVVPRINEHLQSKTAVVNMAKGILIVGLSTDDFNLEKNKVCEIPYEKRRQLLESLPFVDLVISEETWDQKKNDILTHQADVFVMGDDWKGKFDDLSAYCEVRYFPRTKGISTTALKKAIKES